MSRKQNKPVEYHPSANEIFADRYVYHSTIGHGAFGKVFRVFDQLQQRFVALKAFRAEAIIERHARMEVEIIALIHKLFPDQDNFTVNVTDHFFHQNHACFIMELLSMNLFEVLKHADFKGLPLPLIRCLALQMFQALNLYSSSSLKIVHSDIKPENIMLENPFSPRIKIIDFGCSSYDDFKPYLYIQSRYYRSPEVLLGLKYSFPIDIWSLGCVLVELHTGNPLFVGKNERETMWSIVQLLGLPPQSMIYLSRRATHYFDRGTDMKWRLSSKANVSEKTRSLESLILEIRPFIHGCPTGLDSEYEEFLDFVRALLVFDPEKRLTSAAALAHPFLVRAQDDLSTAERILQTIVPPQADVRSSYVWPYSPEVGHIKRPSSSHLQSPDDSEAVFDLPADAADATAASYSSPALAKRAPNLVMSIRRQCSSQEVSPANTLGSTFDAFINNRTAICKSLSSASNVGSDSLSSPVIQHHTETGGSFILSGAVGSLTWGDEPSSPQADQFSASDSQLLNVART
eukprot:TRINITY_DN20086_c0_g1_i1.p1 TRINITY_DN20086_c0_g1~~TRINITY_DN20086_c0_g1_i1.p1  ORF type:complete len:517 (-),score=86.53 TRINITY_DN20086_c0_g1_i1:91-1641(-)